MRVQLHWNYAEDPHDPDDWFHFRRVVYTYLHPRSRKPLYIGKADRLSVHERMVGRHKDDVLAFIYDLGARSLPVLVGLPILPEGSRLSSALLSDIESLLILALQPQANIQSMRSRICRPGMQVTCHGKWPIARRRFVDSAA